MRFSNRLKAILKFKGLQQKDLAQGIGASETMVSRWCKNITTPKVNKLVAIAKFLNVSVTALTGQEELFDKLLERYYGELV